MRLKLGLLVAPLVVASAFAAVPARSASTTTATDFVVTSSLDGTPLKARFYRPADGGPFPIVMLPHGGGGTVDSDAPRAARFATEGFVGVVWSARGHGESEGLYDLFGPATVQDTKDVLTWILDHTDLTAADPERVGIAGYSQGGGTTNLAAAFDDRIDVIGPGHTFMGLEESLKPNGCAKTSVDSVILAAAYLANRARPRLDLVARWSTFVTAGLQADETRADWSIRSPKENVARITEPSLSVQAFDDPLFPVDHALVMDELEANPNSKLWLSWGGHFAAPAPAYEAEAREDAWHRWMQHWLQSPNGADLEPRVTWWYRASDRTTLVKRQSAAWPPPGTVQRSLGISGSVAHAGGAQGLADDPIGAYFPRNYTPLGEPLSGLPNHTPADTVVTSTEPMASAQIFAGSARADLQWTSTAPESQITAKAWDIAPDGTATMLGRGCTAVTGTPGVAQHVALDLWPSAVEIPVGHRVEVWVQAADSPMWLPAAAPSINTIGPASSVTLPLVPA
ncbi:MAG TPA: CocE/NonD family hydrolase [Acidimicrobiales bacterium]|nr:CocE/NonD family hydrolase [Acidimicrobiales bacterium]